MQLTNQIIFAVIISVLSIGMLLLFFLSWLDRIRLQKSSWHKIDHMSGLTFEKYLSVLFRSMGYTVKITPDRADFGADLILEKDGVCTAVQAKRYQKPVGIQAVQEVVSAKYHYKCQKAMVVTNTAFTLAAQSLAASTHVALIDRKQLELWIENINRSDTH